MLSDCSRNLFKRAIASSGSALDPWVFPPISNYAERLAIVMGLDGKNETQMLEVFENAHPFELIVARSQVVTGEEKYGQMIDIPNGPVVEPSWSKTPFFSKNPVLAARTAWSNNVDFIIGANSFEGLFQAFKEYAENIGLYVSTLNENPAFFAPLSNLKLNSSSPQAKIYGQKIKDLYYGTTNLTSDNLLPFYTVRLNFIKKIKIFIKFPFSSFQITHSFTETIARFNHDRNMELEKHLCIDLMETLL